IHLVLVVAGRERSAAAAVSDDVDGAEQQTLAGAGAGIRRCIDQQAGRQPQTLPTDRGLQSIEEGALIESDRLIGIDNINTKRAIVFGLGVSKWKRAEGLANDLQGRLGLLTGRLLWHRQARNIVVP